MEILGNAEEVPLADLRAHPENATIFGAPEEDDSFASLKQSIRDNGQWEPIIAKADGSIALLQQGDEADTMMVLEKDGAIILRNKWGQLQLDENGFAVVLTSGESFELAPASAQITADVVKIAGGVVSLGAAAAVPLTFAPTSGVVKPAPNILV